MPGSGPAVGVGMARGFSIRTGSVPAVSGVAAAGPACPSSGPAALPVVARMLAAGAAALALYKWLKSRTTRPRPCARHDRIRAPVAPLDEYSFPSGHTLHAVSFGIVVVYHYPALAWLVIPFTVLVALSRLVLGLHYPSDVLAGALLGTALATLALQF